MLIKPHVGVGKHSGTTIQGHHKAKVTEALFTENHIPFLSKPDSGRGFIIRPVF